MRDYEIYDEDNSIDLWMKHTDLSKEEVLKTIKPEFEGSGVTYKIQKDENDGNVMIVTDTDGSTRTYSLNVMVDTSDIYIKM